MRARRAVWFWLLVVIFCLDDSVGAAAGEELKTVPAMDRPNLLFIWIDTLRADSLGCYGYHRNTSPELDGLAQESAVFLKNYTPHTVTLSSFMSIITGLYPFSHGVLHIAKDILPDNVRTLAEVLQDRGYGTAWFGPLEDPHLAPDVGFGRGFDSLDFFDDDQGLAVGTAKVIKQLNNTGGKPFFVNLHTYHVHSPYIPSDKNCFRFTAKRNLGIAETYEALNLQVVTTIGHQISAGKGELYEALSPELVQQIRKEVAFSSPGTESVKKLRAILAAAEMDYLFDEFASETYMDSIGGTDRVRLDYAKALYDAQIVDVDSLVIGPLIRELKRLGLYDNTLVVVCSDHGEEFGEHGQNGHGESLYEEVTWVPLIMKLPGRRRGQLINEFSQTVDIMPTILQLLGIVAPMNVQGKSFAPLLQGYGVSPKREYIYGQMPRFSSIRRQDWKLYLTQADAGVEENRNWLATMMLDGRQERKELYLLADDPGEKVNRYREDIRIGEQLEKDLHLWQETIVEYQQEERPFLPFIDERTRQKILKTGYW